MNDIVKQIGGSLNKKTLGAREMFTELCGKLGDDD